MRTARRLVLLVATLLLSVAALFPFYWMTVSSFQSNSEIFTTMVNLIPRSLSLHNFRDLLSQTRFLTWIMNSVIVTASTTLLGLFLSALGGFAFAKYRFRGRDALFLAVFLMISVPRFVTIIPIFRSMSVLHLTNTYWALILPFAVNPFAVFLVRQYARSVPDDLLDSGRIDGLNELQLFGRIVLPVIRPCLGAAGIFILMMSWNDYLFPLIMMSEERKMVFTVGLTSLKTLYVVEYGMIMAGSLLSTLPLILAFLVLQKQFVAGLTEGAIKQ